ncbi:type II methionyl aminopeptidase [archaeon]|nr:MAG: type II methionyl aminopeptidase [archaeon]
MHEIFVIIMDKQILDKYLHAGRIAKETLDYGKALVKDGAGVLEIAEAIEKKIFELGGKPAFPVNIGINETAAHFTPVLQSRDIIKAEDYVKLDLGVHIDGYIADTAVTIRSAGKDKMILCSEKMLDAALPFFVPGGKLSEIGEAIENVSKEFGFNPIRNLTGHGLKQYDLHAGTNVYNVKNSSKKILEAGGVYAIEPFCTTGTGLVKDSEPALIFMWLADKPVRSAEARKILELAKNKYNGLPFAKRWLEKSFSPLKLNLAINELSRIGALHAFAQLKEVSGKPVAQSEHTVIVAEKPIVTTG